jgi:hypothetical protein
LVARREFAALTTWRHREHHCQSRQPAQITKSRTRTPAQLNNAERHICATSKALIAIADTASSPEEAQQTPEFAEYQAANADGSSRVCQDAVAKLDELAASSEEFADQPWISGLGITVRVAFGCVEVETG